MLQKKELDMLTVMRLMKGVITVTHTFIHIIKLARASNKLGVLSARPSADFDSHRSFMCIKNNSMR